MRTSSCNAWKALLVIVATRIVQSWGEREACDHVSCEDGTDRKYTQDAKDIRGGGVNLKPGDVFVVYNSTESGYQITDTVSLYSNGSLRMFRVLGKHINLETRLTIYDVKIPKKISAPIKTIEWEISHTDVPSDYIRFMVESTYAVGSITFDETKRYEVVCFGLGGGSINNYFRHATKNVNVTVIEICEESVELAKKYFGFQIDERQKCIIHDATVFVKEAAGRGEKYDIIMMDVSHSIDGMLAAPPRVFADPSIVQYYPKILKSSGALIVDFLNSYDKTIDLDENVFQIIICVKQYGKYKAMENGKFETNLRKVEKMLNFPSSHKLS